MAEAKITKAAEEGVSAFKKISYTSLNAKQKEVHNFHHIAAVLARHGYASYPIRDDWNGGDMIARHMTDATREMLTIQIKGRVTFDQKYRNKNLWIGFPHQTAGAAEGGIIYIYPHDEILARYGEVRAAKGQQPLEPLRRGDGAHARTPLRRAMTASRRSGGSRTTASGPNQAA